MRYFRWTTLLIVVVGAVGWLSLRPTTQAQSGNLLTNPGFDGPYTAFIPQTPEQHASCPAGICGTAQVPNGWTPFWIGQTAEDEWWENKMPEYKPVCPGTPCPYMNRVKGGEQALQYFNFEGTNTAGVWQRVTVPANARLTFSAWGMAWSSDGDNPVSESPTSVNMRVGIDPLGGSSPFVASIVWTDPKNPYDAYSLFEVQATAQGDTVTVFLLAQPAEMRKHNDFYWDEVSLVVGGTSAAAPTGNTGSSGSGGNAASSSTSASDPTPTPNAEGLILITVQPGDTMWAIAARAGLTLDAFLALNPGLTSDSFIQVGEQYIIGQVAQPTATPEPTATATAIPPTTEPTEEPTVEPTATPSGGGICLLAFADINEDGVMNEAETRQKGVAFTITSGEMVISHYLTDGLAEPYCIEGLPVGDYTVSRSLAENEVASEGAEQTVTVTARDLVDLAWGSYVVEPTPSVADEVAQVENSDAAATPAPSSATPEAESGPASWLPFVLIGLAAAVFLLLGVIIVIMRGRRTN